MIGADGEKDTGNSKLLHNLMVMMMMIYIYIYIYIYVCVCVCVWCACACVYFYIPYSDPIYPSSNSHCNLTFGSFDLVSSPFWWEVETNIPYLLPLFKFFSLFSFLFLSSSSSLSLSLSYTHTYTHTHTHTHQVCSYFISFICILLAQFFEAFNTLRQVCPNQSAPQPDYFQPRCRRQKTQGSWNKTRKQRKKP